MQRNGVVSKGVLFQERAQSLPETLKRMISPAYHPVSHYPRIDNELSEQSVSYPSTCNPSSSTVRAMRVSKKPEERQDKTKVITIA